MFIEKVLNHRGSIMKDEPINFPDMSRHFNSLVFNLNDPILKDICSYMSRLSNEIDKLLNNLGTMTGHDISINLQQLQDDILERKGFSGVLRQIRMSIQGLKNNKNLLNPSERQELINKVAFWRNKLKI